MFTTEIVEKFQQCHIISNKPPCFFFFVVVFLFVCSVESLPDGCDLYGRCYRSFKKNEEPHKLKVKIFLSMSLNAYNI